MCAACTKKAAERNALKAARILAELCDPAGQPIDSERFRATISELRTALASADAAAALIERWPA